MCAVSLGKMNFGLKCLLYWLLFSHHYIEIPDRKRFEGKKGLLWFVVQAHTFYHGIMSGRPTGHISHIVRMQRKNRELEQSLKP